MALFTTFLTTPLLHFVYIRNLPKERADAVAVEGYSVLGCVRHMKVASSVVHGSLPLYLFLSSSESVIRRTETKRFLQNPGASGNF